MASGRPPKVRIRVSAWARYGLLTAAVVLLIASILLRSSPWRIWTSDASSFAVIYGLGACWFGITLTPTTAVVNGFRRRRVPWSDVRAVTQEDFLGGRRIVLWTTTGRRIVVRYPVVDFSGLGRTRFEAGFHTIGQWWLAYRSGPTAGTPGTGHV